MNSPDVAFQAEGHQVSQVGVHLHPSQNHQAALLGQGAGCTLLPDGTMFGDAHPVQTYPFGLFYQLGRGETAVRSSSSGVNMEIDKHRFWQSSLAQHQLRDKLLYK